MTGVLGVAFSSAAGSHIIPHIMNVVRRADAAQVSISETVAWKYCDISIKDALCGFIRKFKTTLDYKDYTLAQLQPILSSFCATKQSNNSYRLLAG